MEGARSGLAGKYRVRDGVLLRKVADEAVLLDLSSSRYFGLNETGRRIWTLLGDGCDLVEVLDRLEQEYDSPRSELESGLRELILRLEGEGLVSPTD